MKSQKQAKLWVDLFPCLGWKETELARRRKGDEEKVRVAQRLRRETTMTLAWTAQRLEMGSWTYVSNLLNQRNRAPLCQK
jgi:hypothetical protein